MACVISEERQFWLRVESNSSWTFCSGDFEGMLKQSTQQTMVVTKRDGRLVSFDSQLITRAIEKAFGILFGNDIEPPRKRVPVILSKLLNDT